MYHRFLWWVHKFFLIPAFQIPVVLALCILLTPTFHKHMLPLVSPITAFSGKNDRRAGHVTLCSVIQACLIEIVYEVCFEGATASDILVSSIHTPITTA
jgi:hypothetical protein